MQFGWINAVNAFAVICLIAVNILCARRGLADSWKSRHTAVNVFEQIGRCGCMALMILPLTAGWEFGFASPGRMIAWLVLTFVLLAAYSILWACKRKGGKAVLYALAVLPVCLFLQSGVLLRHWLLAAFALLFGVFPLWIVQENVMGGKSS